jgi:nitrate reductase delta subunit
VIVRPRPRRTAALTVDERTARLIWRLSALLLDYPGVETLAMLDDLTAAAGQLPDPARGDLTAMIDRLRAGSLVALAADYVETFDLRRRNSLHLTYYAHGDTRGRGMALLRFKHAYRAAGVDVDELENVGELPDHLPLVLEFAATVDSARGAQLLGEHVPVLELLRLSLSDAGSPYAGVLAAVLSTLPPLTTADRRTITRLAAEGPPSEEVGVEPFSLDPVMGGRR